MAQPTPAQRVWQGRFESVIRLMAPGLDLLLAAGDRVSRLVGGDDDWEPPAAIADRDRATREVRAGPPPNGRS